jgi:hypothetical protein
MQLWIDNVLGGTGVLFQPGGRPFQRDLYVRSKSRAEAPTLQTLIRAVTPADMKENSIWFPPGVGWLQPLDPKSDHTSGTQ